MMLTSDYDDTDNVVLMSAAVISRVAVLTEL